MIFQIECQSCGQVDIDLPMSTPAKDGVPCPSCKGTATIRLWTMPSICTVGCSGGSDPNDIPLGSRVNQTPWKDVSPEEGLRVEKAYHQNIERLRKSKKASGSLRMLASIPGELYHGKIRETGDQSYWDDPKNRSRHKDFEV